MNDIFNKVDHITYQMVEKMNQMLLLIMVGSVSYSVFARVFFNNPPNWGEEVGAFCIVWITFLSTTLAIRDGRHMRITVLSMVTSEKVEKYSSLISYFVIIVIGVLMMKYGTDMTILSKMNVLPSTQISRAFITVVVPLSGALSIILCVGKVREILWK